jgi:hypothetical protein
VDLTGELDVLAPVEAAAVGGVDFVRHGILLLVGLRSSRCGAAAERAPKGRAPASGRDTVMRDENP